MSRPIRYPISVTHIIPKRPELFLSPQIVNKGTIPPLPAKEESFNGKVVRPLRSVNPDQDEYCGLIQTKSEEGVGELFC